MGQNRTVSNGLIELRKLAEDIGRGVRVSDKAFVAALRHLQNDCSKSGCEDLWERIYERLKAVKGWKKTADLIPTDREVDADDEGNIFHRVSFDPRGFPPGIEDLWTDQSRSGVIEAMNAWQQTRGSEEAEEDSDRRDQSEANQTDRADRNQAELAAKLCEADHLEELTGRQRLILETMLEHEITSDRRKKDRKSIVRLINRTHNSQSYGRDFANLVKRSLLQKREGPMGGVWLTPTGTAEAVRLRDANKNPQL